MLSHVIWSKLPTIARAVPLLRTLLVKRLSDNPQSVESSRRQGEKVMTLPVGGKDDGRAKGANGGPRLEEISENEEKIRRIRQRYNKVLNMRTEMHKSGNGFTYFVPGLKFDDFNRAGYPELYKANRIFEWSRFNQWEYLGFKENSNNGYVTSTLEVRITRSFYNFAAVYFPLKVTIHATEVGNSSFRAVQYLRAVDPNNAEAEGEILMARHAIFINVDLSGTVKKPIPVDVDIRERCQQMLKSTEVPSLDEFKNMVPLRRNNDSRGNSSTSVGLKSSHSLEVVTNSHMYADKNNNPHNFSMNNLKVNISQISADLSNNFQNSSRNSSKFTNDSTDTTSDSQISSNGTKKSRDPFNLKLKSEPPAHAFQCSIIPRAEDCDLFAHTTQSFYFCYMREAEAQAAEAGYSAPESWKEIAADPAERLVSRTAIEHKKELKMWEPVNVMTWYDDEHSGVMHFIIKNQHAEVVCLAFIEFHSNIDSKVSAKL